MKRFLIVLLTVLLLATCTACKGGKKTTPADTGTDYLELIRTYESREKNPAQTTDDPEFDAFLDKVFAEGISTSSTTVNTALKSLR